MTRTDCKGAETGSASLCRRQTREAYRQSEYFCDMSGVIDGQMGVANDAAMRKWKWAILLLISVSTALAFAGCEDDHYGAYPGYGYGPGYYGRYPGYAPYPGYGYPGYGYPGSVTIAVGDRPYYTRGSGYYVGHRYYVWRPGHWASHHGTRVWVHGHYVLR